MSNMKKKIVFITGTRADYGKIKSLLLQIEKTDIFEAFIYVSGMHLLETFGSTYNEVINDGYRNVYTAFGQMHSRSMSYNTGNIICDFTGYINQIKPDMIVVHGDRIDALAGAVAGALSGIIVAHIEGGEISGTIDESIRHAISKFAHLHFVSNEEAKKRLLQLGEIDENVFIIGSPDIDIMMSASLPSLEKALDRYNIPFTKYGVLMFHPVTTEHSSIQLHIRELVDAIVQSANNYIVIYPNDDLGSEIILNEYKRFATNQRFAIFPSVRFEYFLTLLKNAQFILGNSSAGVREACVYGIPSIDIGSRQTGRYKLTELRNIQHIDFSKEQILHALDNHQIYRIAGSYFGFGDSTERFMSIISNNDIWKENLQKKFIDLAVMEQNV